VFLKLGKISTIMLEDKIKELFEIKVYKHNLG